MPSHPRDCPVLPPLGAKKVEAEKAEDAESLWVDSPGNKRIQVNTKTGLMRTNPKHYPYIPWAPYDY